MNTIKVETIIDAPVSKVWEHWNQPQSIKSWAFASDTWECPYAENDLKEGGRFLTRMSAKDGSATFDMTGTYIEVLEFEKIKYRMEKDDSEVKHRECEVRFTTLPDGKTKIEEEFDPEEVSSEELQKAGWSAILENFKKFVSNN